MTRRGATDLMGILPIDKPAGMTSHDVVARVRRATGEGRVGHAGTLDPMATGLLVVLVGAYTRLAPYLTSAEKSYEATITFGSETDTDDADGSPVLKAPAPERLADPEYAAGVLHGFLGRSAQTPPAYSAIKLGGETAHKAARAGNPLDLAPREIEVFAADLLAVDADSDSWRVAFRVSKGTYVRSLARDIGLACGSAAHLSALRRVTSGTLSLGDAHSLDEVTAAAENGSLRSLFADPLHALGLPVMPAPDDSFRTGRRFAGAQERAGADGSLFSITSDDRLVAIYRTSRDLLEPVVVLPTGGVA
jgi:tRNA pseudouridine55 synthase